LARPAIIRTAAHSASGVHTVSVAWASFHLSAVAYPSISAIKPASTATAKAFFNFFSVADPKAILFADVISVCERFFSHAFLPTRQALRPIYFDLSKDEVMVRGIGVDIVEFEACHPD
jgi:hypothetical protein